MKAKASLIKPLQKFFNPVNQSEARNFSHRVYERNVVLWNKMIFRKGFQYKFFKASLINPDNVNPTLFEIQKFRKPMKADDIYSDSSASDDDDEMEESHLQSNFLVKGDRIMVSEGELKGLSG